MEGENTGPSFSAHAVWCSEEELQVPSGLVFGLKRWRNFAVKEEPQVRILASHGWQDNANSWDHLAPVLLEGLAPKTEMVCFDWTGHGKSSKRPPWAHYGYLERTFEVLELINTLNWKTCILMGHSMGAAVMIFFAAAQPSRVEKLIAVEGFYPLPQNPNRSMLEVIRDSTNEYVAVMNRKPRVYPTAEQARNKYNAKVQMLPSSAKTLLDRGLEECKNEDGTIGVRFCHDPRLVSKLMYRTNIADAPAVLSGLECPVLLIVASVFSLIPKEALDWLQKNLRTKYELVEIEDAKHHLHLDQPKEVAPPLIRFITSASHPAHLRAKSNL